MSINNLFIMRMKKHFITGLIFLIIYNFSHAQDGEKSRWHYLSEVYLMFPGMNGNITVAELPPVEVDASVGDIFSKLKMGAMFYFEATNDNWAISSDLLYMKLGQDISERIIITGGDVTMKQFAWEIAGLKRITPWLEGGLGGRLLNLYSGLNIETINEPREGSASKTWFDPIIIVRSQGAIKEKWLLQFRGDIGGFGLGSDFSWQIQANVGYHFSKLFQTTIGYRFIGINYDKGEGRERFQFDVDTSGLVIRLGFNF
jgi:hypothetical protein